MTISDLAGIEGMETLQADYDDRPITTGYASDLLSDVMAHARDGCVLITIQAHLNTVAVAALAGAAAIVICNNRPIPQDMLDRARDERMAVFRTARNQFETACTVGPLIDSSTCG